MSVDIWSILYISEVSELFRVKFKLAMLWLDPRLHFFNLKNDSYLNAVAPGEAGLIWYPVMVFLNTQNMDQSIVNENIARRLLRLFSYFVILQHDSRSTMTIIRNGSYNISPKEHIHNNHFYSGKDNRISMSRTYTIDFECTFFIHFYPFDIQQCNMNFVLGVFFHNSCERDFVIVSQIVYFREMLRGMPN